MCLFVATKQAVPVVLDNFQTRHDAYHEAGHVVVALILGYGFESVTVQKDETGARGAVKPHPDAFTSPSSTVKEDIIRVALAGVVASSIRYIGNHEDEGYSDNAIITKTLLENPSLAGFSSQESYLRGLRIEVRETLLLNKKALDSISSSLAKKKTLTEADVTSLLTRQNIFLSTWYPRDILFGR